MKEKQYFIKQVVLVALFTIHCSLFTSPIRAQIGTWRNYLSYAEPQQIQAAGNDLFVMASGALYQYNQNDQSIYTYDKVNGMSDVDIKHIRWCKQAKRLVVVYSNSNIDLVETNGNITNISDLYSKTITGDKSVSSVRIDGIYAYLICGFGIVKINVQRAEIAETYTPSNPDYPTLLPDEDNSDYDKYIDLVKTLQPGGPKANKFGYMKFYHNNLYTCSGDHHYPEPIQILQEKEWIYYSYKDYVDNHGINYLGFYCLDIDPNSSNHIIAGSRNGLYEFLNGQLINFYNDANSPIEAFDGKSKEYELVTGVKIDPSGNIWLLNSQAPSTSLVKFANGVFTKYNHPELMKLNDGGFTNKSNAELSKMMIDSQGIMWFANNHWINPALYQYRMENDAIKAYETFFNQDGTTVAVGGGIRCITEDFNNNIWIGTNVGPLMLERSEINNGTSTFTQIKVPRNDGTDYADYLLTGIDILDIAIDGAGRKWFASNGQGVYLVSADNMTEIHHFTSQNSYLLSDIVNSVGINKQTGEVFFGTDKGLCSYVSDATEPNDEMTKDNVWAYPNPVKPGYIGPITITGLTLDADVKILAANGALIVEGRSNGGTFVWDGCDKKGRRVASGIYMVATATSSGEKGTVCKIAIVR